MPMLEIQDGPEKGTLTLVTEETLVYRWIENNGKKFPYAYNVEDLVPGNTLFGGEHVLRLTIPVSSWKKVGWAKTGERVVFNPYSKSNVVLTDFKPFKGKPFKTKKEALEYKPPFSKLAADLNSLSAAMTDAGVAAQKFSYSVGNGPKIYSQPYNGPEEYHEGSVETYHEPFNGEHKITAYYYTQSQHKLYVSLMIPKFISASPEWIKEEIKYMFLHTFPQHLKPSPAYPASSLLGEITWEMQPAAGGYANLKGTTLYNGEKISHVASVKDYNNEYAAKAIITNALKEKVVGLSKQIDYLGWQHVGYVGHSGSFINPVI